MSHRIPHRIGAAIALAAVFLAFAAASAEEPRSLRVFAAASLTDVIERLSPLFAGGPVVSSFGSSSELARQIRDGAPADVFVSASREWMDFLDEAGALSGEPVVVARNTLVCIAPNGSPLVGSGVTDPGALLARIGADDVVAIADAGVPAGEYARRSLEHAKLLAGFEPRLVGQKDVRAVLHAVEQREVAAGFVYATDAKVAAVEVLFAFDPATHPPIEYQAAALRGAASPERAGRFLEYLRGDAVRELLERAGFAPR